MWDVSRKWEKDGIKNILPAGERENKVNDRWRPLAAIMVNVHCGSGDISVGIITSVVLFLTLFFGWCFVLYV